MSTAPSASTRSAPWRVGPAEPTGFAVGLALLGAVLVAAPVLSVLTSFFQSPESAATLAHLAHYVMPRASYETLCLAVLVGVGVAVLGTTAAWLVVAHEFPGRRIFEWALLLPLAMPGYIVAYAYTDFLQFAGPVQGALRELFGWQRADYWFPEIRSLPGAGFVFTVVLYPYVYLLARTAFLGRTASMIDAARCLGYTPWRTWLYVNLPLARPAVAAGTLLALMETLADYGAAAYFGLLTYTTAIYRAWFALGDRMAASQLAAVLLLVVLGLMFAERRARGRARFFVAPQSNRPRAADGAARRACLERHCGVLHSDRAGLHPAGGPAAAAVHPGRGHGPLGALRAVAAAQPAARRRRGGLDGLRRAAGGIRGAPCRARTGRTGGTCGGASSGSATRCRAS